jgi:hypothetical protein
VANTPAAAADCPAAAGTRHIALRSCTSRGSNPDHRILSPALSPIKVLVRRAAILNRHCAPRFQRRLQGWLQGGKVPDLPIGRKVGLRWCFSPVMT